MEDLELEEITDLNTFKKDQLTNAQSVAIYLEHEAGPNLCRLERAYAAGYRKKEAEPIPPIISGLIEGQRNIINFQKERLQETRLDGDWHDPGDDLPKDNCLVKAIYKKRRESGICIGNAVFYFLGGHWEFEGRTTVLFTENIIAWRYIY